MATAVLVGLVAVPTAAPAAEEGDFGTPTLAAGEWTGDGSLSGEAGVERDDFDLSIRISMTSDFTFDVTPEGTLDGGWDFDGPVAIDSNADGDRALTFRGSFSGIGFAEGTSTDFTASADFRVTGTASVGTSQVPVDETAPLPPQRIIVTDATCNEAIGVWELQIAGVSFAPGWTRAYDGLWTARRTSADTSDEQGQLQQIEADMQALSDQVVDEWEAFDAAQSSGQPMSLDFAGLLELVREHVRLVNELRALDDCEDDAVGEDGLATHFTHLAQNLLHLVDIASHFELTSTEIRQLMNAAKTTGAMGSGSPVPEQAAAAEESMRQTAEKLVQPHFVWSLEEGAERGFECNSVPCLIPTPEAVDLMVLGGQNGWRYDIGNGAVVNAAAVIAGSMEIAEPASE